MLLTPWEEERLLIFSAAELARRHRAAGMKLNAPEAVALICDAMLEAARAGATYAAVEAAGSRPWHQVTSWTACSELVTDVRIEVLLGDGARLVVLLDPFGGGPRPGRVDPEQSSRPMPESLDPTADLDRLTVTVANTSRRVVRVSSHFPFDRVNARLEFDRALARGRRLDLPAGSSARWAPGETKAVALVRYRGAAGEA